MLREYALVILDNTEKIVDRFNIEIATNSTNNGFKVNLSTISSEIEDIITNVSQQKLQVSFKIYQIYDSYAKSNVTSQWIQKYMRPEYTMALEYNDGEIIRYCVGKVTTLGKTEKVNINTLVQDCIFTQTTPWFIKKENILLFEESSIGKKYPYKYPYSYGSARITNNLIENPYIYEIPLIITINGSIANPVISLLEVTYDNDGNIIEGDTYNTVSFADLTVSANQKLVIDSAKRKITLYTYDGDKITGQEDVTNRVNPENDTFLRAISGFSEITYNRDTVDENFKMIGSWRQYIL